jgi:hypothetical protein
MLPSGYWRAQVRRKGQYVSRSVSAASRLIEAGFDIAEVSKVTVHKDWKMLRGGT